MLPRRPIRFGLWPRPDEEFERIRFRGALPRTRQARRPKARGHEYYSVVVPVFAPAQMEVDLFLGGGPTVAAAGEPEGAVEVGFRLDSTTRILDASLQRAQEEIHLHL